MMSDNHTGLFLPSGCLRPSTAKAFLEKKLEGTDLAAVRQHLYECPFCLDAVEGLSHADNTGAIEQHVAELNEQIALRLAEKKFHATKRKIAVYIPVAATIILLVGIFSIFRSIRHIPAGPENQQSALESDYSGNGSGTPLAMNAAIPKRLMPPAIPEQKESEEPGKLLPANASGEKNIQDKKSNEQAVAVAPETGPQASATEAGSPANENGTDEITSDLNTGEPAGNSQAYPTNEVSSGPSGENIQFYYHVEEMPRFRSGDLTKFRDFVQTSLRYPREALREGIEGTVYVSFIVSADGKVLKPSVIQGISPLLDKEALRAVTSSPDWKPGSHKGNKVSVGYIIPVKFQIEH